MIPPRTVNGENAGNGVRYRVSACRKRLRVSRNTNGTNTNAAGEEQPRQVEIFSNLNDNRRLVFARSGVPEEAEST